MLTRYPRLFPLGALAWLPLAGATVSAGVLGQPGQTGVYRLEADPAARPEFERSKRLTVVEATFRLGPESAEAGRDQQWFGIGFKRLNGEEYQAWLLLDSWPAAARARSV